MKLILKWVRRVARFVVATALWLNALLLLRFARPNLSPLAARLHLNLGETTILVLIASLSILLSYGVKNLLVDALYIYFFPFVLVFLAARTAYFLWRTVIRRQQSAKSAAITQAISTQVQPQTAALAIASPKPGMWDRVRRDVFRPFFQFTLLWGVLLLLTSRRWLLCAALAIVLFHLARTLVTVSSFAVFSLKGLSQLEERIRGWAENLIRTAIAASKQAGDTQDLRKTWGAITALQLGLKLLQYRQVVVQSVICLSAFLFGAIYLYVAVLFSFAYYGIARVQGISYGWPDAFVTSLFIPFQFSDLPHSVPIKIVAGIHCVFVFAVGAGTLFGYLQKKMNSLYSMADSLNQRFQEDDLRTTVQVLTERFGPKKTASTKT
jgi:hypothetical protein